ncbi:hypothetical protein MMC22_006296 [Lobaria immixta]|nr:hypothetical protein [Lobaria immixta]
MVSVGSLRRRGTKRSSDAEEGSGSKRVQVVIDNSTLFPPSPSAARDQRLPLQSNPSKPEQRNKGIIASDQRPPVAETWQVFGDSLSTAYLQSASNSDKYKIACRYFHARLALVARGFTIDELKQIFTSCLPAFLRNDYMDNERKRAFREFEKQHDWVEDRLVERIRGYAKLWLQSPGGSYYRDQYLVSRKRKKVGSPLPIPDHNAITQFQGRACLRWNRTQLIDIWLPCLAAVETLPTRDNTKSSIAWIQGDASDHWYNALELTAACLVIKFARLLLDGEAVNDVKRKKDKDSEELYRPAVRKILRTYMTFPLDSPDFSKSVKAQLAVKKNSMMAPLDLDSVEPAVDDGEDGAVTILDPEKFPGDPLALHVGEEREMEDQLLAEDEELAQLEKQAENTLMQEHAQEVAKIMKESDFLHAKHNFLSLRTPVVAAEDESPLVKAYLSKGPIGRIIQVRAEIRLERKRLVEQNMQAVRRMKVMDEELKLLEEEEESRALVGPAFLAQLAKNREKKRLIKEKRAAEKEFRYLTPLELSSSQAQLLSSSEDVNEAMNEDVNEDVDEDANEDANEEANEDVNEDEAEVKRDEVLVRKRRPRTDKISKEACKAALAKFAVEVWPNGTDELMFSSTLRQKIACAGVRIASVEDLRKELRPVCVLERSHLSLHADDIVKLVSSTVRAQGPYQGTMRTNALEHCRGTEQERGVGRGRGGGGGRPRGSLGSLAEREARRVASGLVGGGELMDWRVTGGLNPNHGGDSSIPGFGKLK